MPHAACTRIHHHHPGLVDDLAATHPGGEAVVAPEARASWAELAEQSVSCADALVAHGIEPGDRVGILLPNGLRWIVATLAAHRAGATVVPINTWYHAAEIAHVLDGADVRLVVTDAEVFGRDTLAELAAAGLAADRTLVWRAGDPPPSGPPATLPGATPDGVAYVLFTSGSTSRPKPVPLRHNRLAANSREIGGRMHVLPGDRLWISAPFFFGYGCANALPVAFTHGLTLCVEERPAADASLAFIARERCTVYYGFGATTRNLLAAPGFATHDLSSLRTGSTGFTAEDKRLVREELGVREICGVYGLTEAYGHSAMTDAHDPIEVLLHTAGRVLDSQELRITDLSGREMATGETGEIELRGCVMDGYLGDPAANTAAFREGGWFRTGDLGQLDADGRLRVVGRLKEMLKVKGISIAPAEVEELLCTHPAVDQAFVVGQQDDHGDEEMLAAVVPREGAPLDLPAQLVAHVRGRAASYKVPARIVVLTQADIPLTDTGKVNKRLLKERIA